MKLLHSKNVYKGKFINVKIREYEEKGKKFTHEIIEAGEGVLIIALNEVNSIVLIKQKRSNHGVIYEVPAGGLKIGETPLQAAKRELTEETGLKAEKWSLVSSHHNGVHEEGRNYIFLARDLSSIQTQFDTDEIIAPYKVYPIDQAITLIEKNKVIDIRNRACIWLAQLLILKDVV